jgi:hypothetical protein
MKNLSIVLASFLMGASPLLADDPSVPPSKIEQISQQPLGSQVIAEIRKGYESGEYDRFLKELDDSYQTAREKNQLTQLIEMREGVSDDWRTWEELAQKLQEKKGKELIAALEDEAPSPFKTKVLSSVADELSPEQEEAIFHMAALRQMAPNTGKNDDENQLIDRDVEYEYKSLHASMPGKSAASSREQQMVLRMDKAKKMLDLSASFKDAALQKDVALYAQNLDQRLAKVWDTMDLNGWVNGPLRAESESQEKVASILKHCQEEFSELAQQYLAKHDGK